MSNRECPNSRGLESSKRLIIITVITVDGSFRVALWVNLKKHGRRSCVGGGVVDKALAANMVNGDRSSYEEAMARTQRENRKKAIREECNTILKYDTFEVTAAGMPCPLATGQSIPSVYSKQNDELRRIRMAQGPISD